MPKISVVLDDQTHREAKIAAMDANVSLSQWVAGFITKQLQKRDKRKQAVA